MSFNLFRCLIYPNTSPFDLNTSFEVRCFKTSFIKWIKKENLNQPSPHTLSGNHNTSMWRRRRWRQIWCYFNIYGRNESWREEKKLWLQIRDCNDERGQMWDFSANWMACYIFVRISTRQIDSQTEANRQNCKNRSFGIGSSLLLVESASIVL